MYSRFVLYYQSSKCAYTYRSIVKSILYSCRFYMVASTSIFRVCVCVVYVVYSRLRVHMIITQKRSRIDCSNFELYIFGYNCNHLFSFRFSEVGEKLFVFPPNIETVSLNVCVCVCVSVFDFEGNVCCDTKFIVQPVD